MTTTGSFRNENQLLDWFNSGPAAGAPQASRLQGIVKGGSVRRFYRLLAEDGSSLGILMEYSREKEENNFYVAIGEFLDGLGIPVPRILFHDAEEGLAWLEDFGSVDLVHFRDEAWEDLKPKYESVIDAILPLWRDGMGKLEEFPDLPMMDGFGSRLYAWERDYFFDQCLKRMNPDLGEAERESLHAEMSEAEDLLLAQPVTLVHRDFQSHNIMIREAGPGFIDFQGMRQGTWFYDLASLLFDPYMSLSADQRVQVAKYAREKMDWSGTDAEFLAVLEAAALQRLMQALGAYGYLGHELGKKEFLQYIPVAGKNLVEIVSETEMPEIEKLLSSDGFRRDAETSPQHR